MCDSVVKPALVHYISYTTHTVTVTEPMPWCACCVVSSTSSRHDRCTARSV